MKIRQVQNNQSFQAKQRYLNKNTLCGVKTLLVRMNEEAVCKSEGKVFQSKIVHSLKCGDEAVFRDGRFLLGTVSADRQMQKQTFFKAGKSELVINNETGEITHCDKPFYPSWKRIESNFEKYIKIFVENYDKPEIIKKQTFSILGLTEEGFKSFRGG